MRAIDADALEKEGWSLHRTIQVDKNTSEYQTKPLRKVPTIEPEPHWIPCKERLPKESYGCLVTVWDTNPITMDEFENILPYFVGWDGEQWNDADGEQCPFEVIAWMPLPEPYREGE